jgi:homoserine acetyltransferase
VTPLAGDFVVKSFTFTSGEKLPELRIHYMTLGTPVRDAAGHVTNAVLIMHGTTGSGQAFARKPFADELALASSAPMADQKRLPTRDAADKDVEDGEKQFAATHDANDVLYAVAASRDYDPSADLEKITAQVLLVNSADDFINPPELGIAEREIRRVRRGRFILIPASESTHGHGTHSWATFWQKDLRELLASAAKK